MIIDLADLDWGEAQGELALPIGILLPQPIPARRPQPRPRKQTRAAKRPWLKCLHCGRRLVQIDIFCSMTTLQIGRAYADGTVPIVCPDCLTRRQFVSRGCG